MKKRSFLNRLSWSGFALLCFLLLATPLRPGPPVARPGSATARLHLAPVPLDRANPARDRVGDLVFLGGWALASDDPRFGGISAMHVEAGRVTAISDAGTLLVICCENGANGAAFERMPQSDGSRAWTLSRKQDAENPQEFWEYCDRRRGQDEDLWIVELDIANAQRFIA